MLPTINSLREIARRCMDGEPLDAGLAEWLGVSLQQFLTQQVRSLDEALGLRNARGGVPWWLEEAMRVRDAMLRELADRLLPDLSVSGQAARIHALATRYAASAWRIDREHDEMPPRYAGTTHEYLWRAFKAGAPMPIGQRQLRNILAR